MPPRDPNTMPEFKLIDGWHIAVSQPVHNPAALAIERAKAAAALLPPGPMYIDNAMARTSAVFADAESLSDKELPAAKAEKGVCRAGGSGSHVQQFRAESVRGFDLLRCVRME